MHACCSFCLLVYIYADTDLWYTIVSRHIFSFIHSGTSYRGFGVKPDGKLYVELSIEPKRTYSFAVYLDFEGIDYKGNSIEGTAAANIHIYSLGMLQAAVIHTIHNLPLQLVPHLTLNFSLIVFSVIVYLSQWHHFILALSSIMPSTHFIPYAYVCTYIHT